jgi:hypothetical protein
MMRRQFAVAIGAMGQPTQPGSLPPSLPRAERPLVDGKRRATSTLASKAIWAPQGSRGLIGEALGITNPHTLKHADPGEPLRDIHA